MEKVSLYYWAGAKAAAGVESESVSASSVAEALRAVVETRADPAFSRVVKACSLLVDGVAAHPDDLERGLSGPVRVDVLPPFAGGASSVSARTPSEARRFVQLSEQNM
jgi:sulfur-carrier protein